VALAAGVALAVPSTADAGTAFVTDDGTRQVLHFAADPGEVNDVLLTAPTDATYVQINDAGPIAPGTGCVAGGLSIIALCDRTGIDEIVVELGDQADRLQTHPTVATPMTVDGGDGDDQLGAGTGPSAIDGGAGDDWLFADAPGATAADVYSGGPGHDTVFYANRHTDQTITLDDTANDGDPGEGDDVRSDVEEVHGGFGDDTITGGAGPDVLFGGEGVDTLTGLGGDDTLDGWLGCAADTLSGGAGNDTLILNGRTRADGGPDDDTFRPGVETCGGTDVHGGDGRDLADLRLSYGNAWFSLDDVANDGWLGSDNYHSDIEDMNASAYAGTALIGSAGPNVLTGGPNDDLLAGGGGADTLIGGDGIDVADYSDHAGPVTLTLDGAANDGSPGENDQIAADVENLRGGAGNDTLTGDAHDNVFDGGPGADVIAGGSGFDAVDYFQREAPVRVDLDGSPGNDGEQGEGDTVGADVEGVFGGLGADTLIGGSSSGFLAGAEGDDVLVDRGGSDVLDGGDGDDVLDSTDGAFDGDTCGDGDDEAWRDAPDEVADDCESVAIGPRTDPQPAPATPGPVRPSPVPSGVRIPARPAGPQLTAPRPVAPIDRVAPTARISVAQGTRLRALLARGMRVDVRCSESCRVDGKLIARGATARGLRRTGIPTGATLAHGAAPTGTTTPRHVALRPTNAGRRALTHLRNASLDLVLTITDRAGNHRRIVRHVSLRR
jgi:Ca2+-binding RTX toxin-like protein